MANRDRKPTKDKNKSERDTYANFAELGICTTCRKQSAEEDSTRCYDCNELRKKKFFPPRDETNKVQIVVSSKERQDMVLENIKINKILFKKISKNLYQTPIGNRFITSTISYFKDSITKGRVFRIRNEIKIECDFYAAYCPENENYYIIPITGVQASIYFTLEEIEKYKDQFSLLIRG
jgi:hypothetical protein